MQNDQQSIINPISRRRFMRQFSFGVGASAFAYLCAQEKSPSSELTVPHLPA
jgi:hypothetical protein